MTKTVHVTIMDGRVTQVLSDENIAVYVDNKDGGQVVEYFNGRETLIRKRKVA